MGVKVNASHLDRSHRLKRRPQRGKNRPPPIIVKFVSRDIRNDVYELWHQIKEKSHWRLYGMQKIYINESLSPETRKLLYKTKQFTREMQQVKGRLFVWTFKGDIYLRKDSAGAPKVKITSELDLNNITEGKVSLNRSSSVRSSEDAEVTANDNVYYILSNDSDDIDIITIWVFSATTIFLLLWLNFIIFFQQIQQEKISAALREMFLFLCWKGYYMYIM